MSSKTKSCILCVVMLMSVLLVGFPVMESSEESRIPEAEKEEGPMSGPGTLSSTYSASIVIGADNDQYDGQGMGRLYKSSSRYYSYDYPYWYIYKSGTNYESRPFAVYDLSDLAQYENVNIVSGTIHYWRYYRYYIKTFDVYTMNSIPYDTTTSSSTVEGWFNEIGGSGSVRLGTETYTGSSDPSSARTDRWITITSNGIDELNQKLNTNSYDFSMGALITSFYSGTYGYAYCGDVRLELDFTYTAEPDEAKGEIAVGDELAGYGYSTTKYDYYNYVYLYSSSSYVGYATWDADLFNDLIPTSGPEGETVTLTGVYLRANSDYIGGSPTVTINDLFKNPKTDSWSSVYDDAGDGKYCSHLLKSPYPAEYEWDLGPDALDDFSDALDGTPNFFGVGFTSTGYGRLVSPKLVIKWTIDYGPRKTLQLGPDNPEYGGHAQGYTYQYGTNTPSCYSRYYSYMYKSSSSEQHGWAVFDLKDLTQWPGVSVKKAKLVVHNYYNYYANVININALQTTPFDSPGSAISNAVHTESGSTGIQIGSYTTLTSTDTTYKRIEIPLNSAAVTALNDKLSSSPTYYTFGVGMYIDKLYGTRTYGYARWTDVRLAVTFDCDSELESTPQDDGVAFGDDWSGYVYKRTSAEDRPYGYQYLRKYTAYEYRSYAQWDVWRIRDVFPEDISDIKITKVGLRFNHYMSRLSNIYIYQMIHDVTTASDSDIFTDCGDGTQYFGPGSYSSTYREEYEFDMGEDAVNDFQDAFEDNDPTFFGLGMVTTSTSGSAYDYGPKLVLEWTTAVPPVADAGPDQTVNEGDVVTLDGTASYHPMGTIETYEWDYESDGTYDYQETSSSAPDGAFDGKTTHIYGDDGVYTATLRVIDGIDVEDTDTCTVTANNVAPIINSVVAETIPTPPLNLPGQKVWYVDDVPGSGPGNPSEDFTSIQSAINAASQNDIVYVYSGTYSPSTNGEAFPIVMKNGISLIGERASSTILNAESTDRVIHCEGITDSSTRIEGFKITGGLEQGGGIYCEESSLTIINNIITNNRAFGGEVLYPFEKTEAAKGWSITSGNNYVRGHRITCMSDNIYVTELGVFLPPSVVDKSDRYVTLFEFTSKKKLAQVQIPRPFPGDTWNFVKLDSPVPLTKGTDYVVAEWGYGYYWRYVGGSYPPTWDGDSNFQTIRMQYANSATKDTFPSNYLSRAYVYGVPDIGYTIGSGGGSGGGILCEASSPAITQNIISENEGGGIYCLDSSPSITNNVIINNGAGEEVGGGGEIFYPFEKTEAAKGWSITTGNNYVRGHRITCLSDDIYVTELGVFLPPSVVDKSDRYVTLFEFNTRKKLAQVEIPRPFSGDTWNFVKLDSPVLLTKGTDYVVAEWGYGYYWRYVGGSYPPTWDGDSNFQTIRMQYANSATKDTFPSNYLSSPYIYGVPDIGYTIGGGSGGGIHCSDSSPTITNNLIIGNGGSGICSSLGSPTITCNDVWGNMDGNYFGCSPGTGSISMDPMFANPASGDYRLKSNSPCIDVGDNSAPGLPPTDFHGNPRICDGDGDGTAVVDMGAFEFGSIGSYEGSEIILTAVATDKGSDDLTFSWEFEHGPTIQNTHYNDGVGPEPVYNPDTNEIKSPSGTFPFSAQDTVSHTYGDNYKYTLILKVTDDDGTQTMYTTTIDVDNLAPSLTEIIIPTNVDEGTTATYSASASDFGSDDLIFTWNWGDGTSDTGTIHFNDGSGSDPYPSPWGTYPFAATDTISHVYGDNGVYTLTVTIEDDDNGIITYTTSITVNNVVPTINSITVPNGDEGTLLTFSSTATDKGSDDLTFTWKWGDGTSDTVTIYYNDGANPDPYPSPWGTYPFSATDTVQHTYGDNGVYTITLIVEDDDNGSITLTINVTIDNVSPTIDSTTAPGGDEGVLITYTSTATDAGSDDLTFTWKWGDGTSDTVTIYYNDGANPDPYPSPWGTYPFTATDTVDHIYGDNGVYTIILTVRDDDNGETTYTINVTIHNVAPTITPFGPFIVDEGMALDLSAVSTDQGSDDLTFTWEFELGPTITNIYYNDGVAPDPYPSPWGTFPFSATDQVSHTYGDDGVYTVTLTVVDDDNGITTYTTTITVNNVAPTITNVEAYIHLDFTLRATGEKWHNVQMFIKEDGKNIAFAEVVRYPGDPDDQSKTLYDVKCDVTSVITVTVLYTPLDDPVNGQPNGATPVWVNISFEDGGFILLKHNFNVNQPKNWQWNIGVNKYLVGHAIIFEASASDQGTDDLTFTWKWGDGGLPVDTLCCNDGINPEPYYDPVTNSIRSPWGTCPFSADDLKTHTFTRKGDFTVELSVVDDDNGVDVIVVIVIIK